MTHAIGRIVFALAVIAGLSLGDARTARAQLPACYTQCTCATTCLTPCRANGDNMTCGEYNVCKRKCRAPGWFETVLARVGIVVPAAVDDASCGVEVDEGEALMSVAEA